MRELTGAEIDSLPTRRAVKVADLIFYDGPLLSVFRNPDGRQYLYKWCDVNSVANRWLVWRVEDRALGDYRNGRLSLRELMTNPPDDFLYSVEIDSSLVTRRVLIVSVKQLPLEYIPSENSFYDDDPITYTDRIAENLQIPIFGHWGIQDLYKFPRLFSAVYGFVYHSTKGLQQPFTAYPMRDGFSSMHLWKQILDAMPSQDRPALRAFSYASPGRISLRLNGSVVKDVAVIISNFREKRHDINQSFSQTIRILKDQKLLGKDVRVTELTQRQIEYCADQAIYLLAQLAYPNPEIVLERSPTPLMALKVSIAFYRLLGRLMAYNEGKASLSSMLEIGVDRDQFDDVDEDVEFDADSADMDDEDLR